MKLLCLNSPEIFIILVVLLSILGTKRIEKGLLLFKKFLKFLLTKEENQTLENSKVKLEVPEESEVKEETIEAEVNAEEPEESEVKEETIESEESEVKEEAIEPKVKSIKPKKRKVKEEIIDVEINLDNE